MDYKTKISSNVPRSIRLSAMRHALCPMRYALCAMPYALCAMPLRHALCPMRHALCPLRHALCAMRLQLLLEISVLAVELMGDFFQFIKRFVNGRLIGVDGTGKFGYPLSILFL